MAKSALKKSNDARNNFKGFIQCELTDAQKVDLKKTKVAPDELFNRLSDLIESGLRISFSYDDYNRCHQAVASYKSDEHEMAGWMLVGRGSLPEKALKQLIFKHYDLLQEQWGSATAQPREVYDD